MPTKLASLALAGAVGVTGAVGATLLNPAVSSAASGAAAAATDRAGRITDALSGLVTDGSITQAQADKVATTLDEAMPDRGGRGRHGGFGGRGGGAAAAEALGITAEELRTQLQTGKTLGQIADAQGVGRDDLVTKLVAAQKAHLSEAVAAGRITQAQADTRAESLAERITTVLDKVRTHGRDHGPDGDDQAPDDGDPAAPSSDSPTTTTSSYTA